LLNLKEKQVKRGAGREKSFRNPLARASRGKKNLQVLPASAAPIYLFKGKKEEMLRKTLSFKKAGEVRGASKREKTHSLLLLLPAPRESVNRDRGHGRRQRALAPLLLEEECLLLLVGDLGVDQGGDPRVAGVELLLFLGGRGDGLCLGVLCVCVRGGGGAEGKRRGARREGKEKERRRGRKSRVFVSTRGCRMVRKLLAFPARIELAIGPSQPGRDRWITFASASPTAASKIGVGRGASGMSATSKGMVRALASPILSSSS
jgi:hypothetical protein